MKDLIIKDKGELKMLEGLYIKGYRYIAKDEEDNINTYVCGYDEPLEIAEVLKANGVGIEPCEICKWGKTSVERYIENLVTLDMRDFVDFNYCFNCGRKLEAEE